MRSRYFFDDFVEDLENQNKLLVSIQQASSFPARMVRIRVRFFGQLEDMFKAYCMTLPVSLSDEAIVALERVSRRETGLKRPAGAPGISIKIEILILTSRVFSASCTAWPAA